ncbi:hypothetical protein BZM26_30930 [Paraburkholderia strydomiana]|nr:hypothetical protein BZM26_30930 [Paraburkholderia strydomiana]
MTGQSVFRRLTFDDVRAWLARRPTSTACAAASNLGTRQNGPPHPTKAGCSGNARQKAVLRIAGQTLDMRNSLNWPRTVDLFYRAQPRIKWSEAVPETIDADVARALLLTGPLLIRRPLCQCDERA